MSAIVASVNRCRAPFPPHTHHHSLASLTGILVSTAHSTHLCPLWLYTRLSYPMPHKYNISISHERAHLPCSTKHLYTYLSLRQPRSVPISYTLHTRDDHTGAKKARLYISRHKRVTIYEIYNSRHIWTINKIRAAQPSTHRERTIDIYHARRSSANTQKRLYWHSKCHHIWHYLWHSHVRVSLWYRVFNLI